VFPDVSLTMLECVVASISVSPRDTKSLMEHCFGGIDIIKVLVCIMLIPIYDVACEFKDSKYIHTKY
jgi:hypothetical protein